MMHYLYLHHHVDVGDYSNVLLLMSRKQQPTDLIFNINWEASRSQYTLIYSTPPTQTWWCNIIQYSLLPWTIRRRTGLDLRLIGSDLSEMLGATISSLIMPAVRIPMSSAPPSPYRRLLWIIIAPLLLLQLYSWILLLNHTKQTQSS